MKTLLTMLCSTLLLAGCSREYDSSGETAQGQDDENNQAPTQAQGGTGLAAGALQQAASGGSTCEEAVFIAVQANLKAENYGKRLDVPGCSDVKIFLTVDAITLTGTVPWCFQGECVPTPRCHASQRYPVNKA